MSLRLEAIQGSDCFERLKGPWQELIPQAPEATPFQTWEWHSTWFQHYGRSKKPYVLGLYQGNDLVGVFPLSRKAGAWYVLRSSGTGPGDYLHPCVLPQFKSDFERMISEHLAEQKHCSLVDLHQLRSDFSDLQLADQVELEQGVCLVLDLPVTYDDYLGTLGKSLRYDVRRLDKSLFREGRAVVDFVQEDAIGQGLEILFEQHKKRWRKRGLPGAFAGRAQHFHQAWGSLAVRNGWLQLGILKLDGQPIGAIYGMALRDTVYFYQAGFDPAQKSVSPGTLLVASLIKRAIADGRRHFDFLRGDEPYKRRWKPQRELRNYRRIAAVHGPMGDLGAKWNLLGSSVEAKVRARLEGKGLI